MASRAKNVLKLQNEIHSLDILDQAIMVVKKNSHIGTNMTPLGYNLVHLIQQWTKHEIAKLKEEHSKMTDIELI